MMRKIVYLALFISVFSLQAQHEVSKVKIESQYEGKPLSEVLLNIQSLGNYRYFFLKEWIEGLTIQPTHLGQPLSDVLDDLFKGISVEYVIMDSRTIVIIKDPGQLILRREAIEKAISENSTIDRVALGEAGSHKKTMLKIEGTVNDAKTGQPLPHVNIQTSHGQGATSDENGAFTLSLPPGMHVLSFTFVDYDPKVIDLAAFNDGILTIEMNEKAILLDEVVIREEVAEVSTTRIGQTQLILKDLKRSPTLLGEADIVKQIQNLPGVTTVGEAAAGFNVRGGSVDQNLILYDGIPVFNSSHVFGFLSSFNAEATRQASFFSGGIPAEYGGRASSVLDIKTRDGNLQKWGGNAGLGMITSNVTVNGPLKKDKTSLLASLRSTYSNWLIHSIRTNYVDLRKSSVFFYDGTLKITHQFSPETKLSVTGYSSQDAFRLVGDTTYRWSNRNISATLHHQFRSDLHGEFIVGRGLYGYALASDNELTAARLSFKIVTTMVKSNFTYQRNNHRLTFGWHISHYGLNPGSIKPTSSSSNAKNFSLTSQYALENALYISDSKTLTSRLSVDAGVRIPLFITFGKADVFTYQGGASRDIRRVTDTLHFNRGQSVKTYAGLEPRLALRWQTDLRSSIKLGYNRMYQFLHLITNTTSVTPIDIWQPSGYYFKPQIADQISIGYFRDTKEKKYALSGEVFYKSLQNIIDFKDGAQLILNNHLETDLLQGKGFSYGAESSLTKNTGRLTATLNYTYSRSFRKIEGAYAGESINKGKTYPSNFDQPHIMTFSWKYNLSRRYFFTGNFTYHTGRPVTVPLQLFVFENSSVAFFSERNQYRIKDYHRLDLALIFEGNHKRKKSGEGVWVISVYNVYGRKNPYSIFFRDNGNGVPKPYQLSIIGTMLPSISYNFRF